MAARARPVVLDCDTGTDDAVAVMLAALHPGLDLLGVTTVWGNVPVEDAADNTLRVLDHVGRADVPVLRGAAVPPEPAPDDRLSPRRLPRQLPLPPSPRAPAAGDAVDWLVETLRATTRPVTLVPTGPLTNIAGLLAADPRVVDAVDEVVLMGGSHAVPNVTPAAEHNVRGDAPAARAVLDAGFRRVVMVTLDATHQALLDAGDVARLRRLGGPAATAAADLVEQRLAQYAGVTARAGRPAAPVHDPVAVACLVDPLVVTLRPVHVTVETAAGSAYGRTWLDFDGRTGLPPNAEVALTADRDRFLAVLFATLGGSPARLG